MKTRKRSNRAGFTLVELMVVAIIVSIMAAVAIPLMSGNKKRAAATEAEAALGVVYRAVRVMAIESGAYNMTPNGGTIANGASVTALPGITPGDLEGTYWREANYQITTISPSSYVITATGGTGLVAGITVSMNQNGTFTRSGL